MFMSPIVIQHGIVALEQEIARLQTIHEECGDEWPPDFDPSDIWLLDSVLKEFCAYKVSGYNEEYWNGKHFRSFVALIPEYVRTNFHSLTDEVRSALFRVYSETCIRICLHLVETDSQSSPSFVDEQILKLSSAILKFPRFEQE